MTMTKFILNNIYLEEKNIFTVNTTLFSDETLVIFVYI